MIREATVNDADKILEIYRYYIENTPVSFAYKAPEPDEMKDRIREAEKWDRFIYLVLEEEGEIKGFASSSIYRDREAYQRTVEVSVYLEKDSTGAGRGRMLMEELLRRLKEKDIMTVIAVITGGNQNSRKAFEKMGFTFSGHLPKVGYKCGEWFGIDKFYKILGEEKEQN